ncbi:MAG TPA: fibronectin type III domain-containing protein [Vicinamibacterales bacterium]|nr:fibronectin type III domain-containing protein [Vicinamibacterales bacterium]
MARLVLVPALASIAIVLLPVFSSVAQADATRIWTAQDLWGFATLVVRGRVHDVASHWDPATTALYTYATIDVAETFKGAAPADGRLVVKMLGGRLPDIELRVAGQAELVPGEDVLLFLETRPRDGTLYPVGFWQGAWRIQGGAIAQRRLPASGDSQQMSLDSLRAARDRAQSALPYVAVPAEFNARSAEYGYLPPSDGGPGRWHEADSNIPIVVDYEAFPSGLGGGLTELNAALALWNTSGMNLQLERGSTRGARCAATFEGDGRISITFDDPCGEVASSGSVVGIGGAYMTPIYRTINGANYTKIIQGAVVLPPNNSSSLAERGCFQDALTHNLGHAIGLAHSTDSSAIMWPNPQGSCASGPSALSGDDRAGVRNLYPTGLPGTPPGTPSNLSLTVSGTSVSLTWTAPTLGGVVATYVVEAGSAPGRTDLASVATGSTVTAVGFTDVPAGFYYVRVRAQNAAGTGNPSNEVTAAVNFVLPGAPANLLASVSGTTVGLNWSAPLSGGPVSNYVIEAGSAPGLSNLALTSTSGPQTSIAFGGVPFGTYYVRVRARNALGSGNASNEIVVQVTCPLPAAPTNLSATRNGSAVTLTWQASAGGATGYILVVGSGPGAADLLVSDVGLTTTVSGTGPPGTYYVRMLARNACGTSASSSNEVVVTIP